MNTEILIDGMSCHHCVNAVTKGLNSIQGVSKVKVDLKKGTAIFESSTPPDEKVLTKLITDEGYTVKKITTK